MSDLPAPLSANPNPLSGAAVSAGAVLPSGSSVSMGATLPSGSSVSMGATLPSGSSVSLGATLPSGSSALAPRPRRVRGLVTEVVESLSASMRDGQLKTGDKLPTESEIMARFDVSRTVVREAISRLQASGLVETRHGIGTFVIEPPEAGNFRIDKADVATVADVIAVLELRISLETEAAGLASQRRTDAQLLAMSEALQAFQTSIELGSDAVPSDFQFHMEVARATGNRHFADLMTYLGTVIIPRTRVNTPSQAPEGRKAYLQRVHGEHESIYTAIRNQDTDAARAAMRTHLSNSRERLRRAQDSSIDSKV